MALACLGVTANCGRDSQAPQPPKTSAALTGTVAVAPTLCPSPKLAESEPKPPAAQFGCPTINVQAPPAAYLAKQQQYLAELAKKAPGWQGLSKEQRDIEQLRLKRHILGN